MTSPVPFNRPYLTGREMGHVERAISSRRLASRGEFTGRCERWLEDRVGCGRAYLAKSGTSALEAAALLAGVGPGDEVVMPSFTYVTTATAFALRGATPVFVDIEPLTLTIDPERAAAAITPATKAIVAVHYAGVGCDMDAMRALADEHGLILIEDAALALLSTFRDQPIGGLGDLAAVSFHETKNLTSGEGGALLVNDRDLRERAEIVWEKGTDRTAFDRGAVDKYQWVGLGSAFGANEVTAAFLWGQLECADEITERRRLIWDAYHEAFADLERDGLLRRPVVPSDRTHNAHLYYLLLPESQPRAGFIDALAARGVHAVFHYVPLHSAPAGLEFGRAQGELDHTDRLSAQLVRLPLWTGMGPVETDRVIEAVREAVGSR